MHDDFRRIRITTVIVTYNRKALLKECILSILSQTYPIWKLIIIDNCSTDGTEELFKDDEDLQDERIFYKRMKSNLGGAGGFYQGIQLTRQMECDWIWIMDDDCIPKSDALEKLILASKRVKDESVSFLASVVKGVGDEPMNVPIVDTRPTKNGYADWYFELKNKMVKILTATFVSLLISSKSVDKIGLPCKDFFIWGDDTEYTTRLTRFAGNAYLVGDSLVCHKRIGAKRLSLASEFEKQRIENYYYYYRNNLIVRRYYSGNHAAILMSIKYIIFAITLFGKKYGISKFCIIIKAVYSGFIEFKKFKKYIDSQINHVNYSM